jgi:hypothetical protein
LMCRGCSSCSSSGLLYQQGWTSPGCHMRQLLLT